MENGIAVALIANVGVAVAVLAALVVLTRNMRNDLNARMDALNARVGDLNVRVDDLKQEQVRTRQEMHALNKELRQEIGEVRRDLYVVGERTARIEGAALGLRRSFNGQADTSRAVPEAPAPTPAP